MQPPNLTRLQSRLLTHVVATFLCLALWTSSAPRHSVYAAELLATLDHAHLDQPTLHALASGQHAHIEGDGLDSGYSGGYAPEFAYLDRTLIGRQADEMDKLTNNKLMEKDIDPGATMHFVLEKSQLRLRRADDVPLDALEAQRTDNASGQETQVQRKRDTDNEDAKDELQKRKTANSSVWISASTCRQPTPNVNETDLPKNHPQLVMYISTSPKNKKPGPDSTKNLATNVAGVLFDSGYASFQVNSTSDVYIGISAPNLDKDWFGSWHFEIAASVDSSGPYHSYVESSPFLNMIDTDSESALFVTYPLDTSNKTEDVDKWRNHNPFRMYAFEAGDWTPISGIEHSFCALEDAFTSNSTKNFTISTNITTKFGDGLPKSQFHVQGLSTAQTYNGFVLVEGNDQTVNLPRVGAVRRGGKVFQQFNWTTKADDSCQVLFDLDFCDTVAYAVPSSSKFKFNDTGLGDLYDNQAREYYNNFNKSLSQVACDTVSEAQYSLARTCKDCATDYKNWLCSVLIPRCEDWTAEDAWLQPRNINAPFPNGTLTFNGNVTKEFNETHRDRFAFSKSRNSMIDDIIQPGPYKEMKPCNYLCYDIVRSCPAQLGFACPNPPADELSYGKQDPSGKKLQCNFPGAVVKLNVESAASMLSARVGNAVAVALMAAVLLWT